MRIEATGQTIRHAAIGLTHDEAQTLLANLTYWKNSAPVEGEWATVLRDWDNELTFTVTNHPTDPRFR
jgi:hypothetical protein